MVDNDAMRGFFEKNPSSAIWSNALPVQTVEPVDVSNAIAWLVSDEARYVTGIMLPVDAGFVNKK